MLNALIAGETDLDALANLRRRGIGSCHIEARRKSPRRKKRLASSRLVTGFESRKAR